MAEEQPVNLERERFYSTYNRLNQDGPDELPAVAFAMRVADEGCVEPVIDLMKGRAIDFVSSRSYKREGKIALFRRIAKTAYEKHQENNARLVVLGLAPRQLIERYQTAAGSLEGIKSLSYEEMTEVLESLQATS